MITARIKFLIQQNNLKLKACIIFLTFLLFNISDTLSHLTSFNICSRKTENPINSIWIIIKSSTCAPRPNAFQQQQQCSSRLPNDNVWNKQYRGILTMCWKFLLFIENLFCRGTHPIRAIAQNNIYNVEIHAVNAIRGLLVSSPISGTTPCPSYPQKWSPVRPNPVWTFNQILHHKNVHFT